MDNKDLIQNMLTALQHQLRATDQALQMLLSQIQTTQIQSNSDKLEQDPRHPVCPKCNAEVSDITTMGAARTQYACTVCNFRGEI